MNQRTLTLNNGIKMPVIGLGTYLSKPKEIIPPVKKALETGYRHIDCAFYYLNEKEIGQALQDFFKEGHKREEVFITSKLWNSFHRPEMVSEAIDTTLKDLQLDYVDLYLVHWPIAQKPGCHEYYQEVEDIPIIDTWREMEKLYKAGKAKAIGVSNFNVDMLKDLLEKAEIKPVINQVELHPYLPQHRLVKFCQDNGIQMTAYCPLGRETNVLKDPVIAEIAKKNNMTSAQVILSWNVQRNVIVIPKSVTPSRIEENFQIKELSKEDIDKINAITIRQRGINAPPESNIFPDNGDF